jgi:hypothetical protein
MNPETEKYINQAVEKKLANALASLIPVQYTRRANQSYNANCLSASVPSGSVSLTFDLFYELEVEGQRYVIPLKRVT